MDSNNMGVAVLMEKALSLIEQVSTQQGAERVTGVHMRTAHLSAWRTLSCAGAAP